MIYKFKFSTAGRKKGWFEVIVNVNKIIPLMTNYTSETKIKLNV